MAVVTSLCVRFRSQYLFSQVWHVLIQAHCWFYDSTHSKAHATRVTCSGRTPRLPSHNELRWRGPNACETNKRLKNQLWHACSVPSVMSDSATPWAVVPQAPQSMRFSRQECWSGLPFPSSGDLLDTGIKLASPVLTGGFFTTEPPGKPTTL